MRVNNVTLSQALFESVQSKPELKKEIVANFVNKLRKSHQLKKLPTILKNIERIENTDKFFVESAFQLSDKNKVDIENITKNEFPKHANYQFIYNITPPLIGGFKVKNQSLEINLTLDQRLNQFKENIWKKL